MKEETMKDLLQNKQELVPFKKHDVVEIEVLQKTRGLIIADIMGLAMGTVHFREWGEEGNLLKPGDKTLAYVSAMENDQGNVVLSLKRADQQRLNQTLTKKYKEKETVIIKCVEANKGGLLCEFGSIRGFLPLSQLSATHYPRVAGDKEKILARLKELIGQELKAKIIGFDKKTNNPIFSEKMAQQGLDLKIKQNDVLEGKVSGITNFGIFVNLGEIDGLVHISEMSWERVEDPSKMVKMGQTVRVKVVAVENGRVFLSMKRLTPDPFLTEIKKLKEGEIIKGVVTRINPYNALVKINKLTGVVAMKELTKEEVERLKQSLEKKTKHQFKIKKINKTTSKIELEVVRTNIKISAKKGKKPQKDKTKQTKPSGSSAVKKSKKKEG